jgi:predicted nucleic acid-binding protein
VLHALVRRERRGIATAEATGASLARLETFAAERVPISGLLRHAYRLGPQFSGPDALYVVLAIARRAELVTSDEGLARAAAGIVGVRFVPRVS